LVRLPNNPKLELNKSKCLCYFAERFMQKDKETLASILKGDAKTLTQLYQDCFPAIRQLVLRNSGLIEDAEDIFQEALVVLYRKIKADNLVLKCTLSTYIYSICRNMWLDRLRRKSRTVGVIDGDQELVDLDDDVIATIYKNDQYALYQKHFQNIGEGCQKLLTLFFEGKSMKLITQIMGFGSEQYARKRKFNCKEKLVNGIKEDPLFDELKQGNTLDINTIN